MATRKCDCEPIFEAVIDSARENMPDPKRRKDVVSFFKVLADETRFSILCALRTQEMCAGDIAVLLDMTKSAVSHQLAVMRNMHQVRYRREGKYVYYSLDDDHIKDIIDEALEHMGHVGEE